MGYNLNEILRNFKVEADIASYGNGHINDTFLLSTANKKYILQRINHSVFRQPYKMMDNIYNVTMHLKKISLMNILHQKNLFLMK